MEKVIQKINEDMDKVRVLFVKEKSLFSESKFISLKEGEYVLNNGNTIVRESAFKKLGTGNAVCIFAVTEDKNILLVVQSRIALPDEKRVNVELPAGYVEEGESVLEAGKRELLEETGYSSDEIFVVDSYYPSLGFSGERITLLLALRCVQVSPQKLDKDEFLYYELVSLEEFETLLNEGYLKDANARIGYYRYLEYLMKEGY